MITKEEFVEHLENEGCVFKRTLNTGMDVYKSMKSFRLIAVPPRNLSDTEACLKLIWADVRVMDCLSEEEAFLRRNISEVKNAGDEDDDMTSDE